jgi:hypothetical protein
MFALIRSFGLTDLIVGEECFDKKNKDRKNNHISV